CTPYISSIAFQIQQELPGTDVRVFRKVAEGEGQVLARVRMLLWLVTGAALLAAALAVGASSAASVIERRTEIGLMKALGAGSDLARRMMADRRATNRAMFWRIIRRLLGANRGRLFVMMLALGAGAAVTATLLNLQVDAKRRLTTEFRAFGPNVLIIPKGSSTTGSETLPESTANLIPV